MPNSRKAEKRKQRKEKKQLELQKKLAEEHVKLDVLQLLREEKLETKPEVADFLKKNVKNIWVFVKDGKAYVWPAEKRVIAKAFMNFLDGHELIWNKLSDGKVLPKVIMCYEDEEAKLSSKDIDVIEQFFLKLQELGFIPS